MKIHLVVCKKEQSWKLRAAEQKLLHSSIHETSRIVGRERNEQEKSLNLVTEHLQGKKRGSENNQCSNLRNQNNNNNS